MWFWNRNEIYHGYSMKDFGNIRDKLSQNKIKYIYKVVDRSSTGVLSSNRARSRSFGQLITNSQVMNFEKEYYLYVHKDNYENALFVLHSK